MVTINELQTLHWTIETALHMLPSLMLYTYVEIGWLLQSNSSHMNTNLKAIETAQYNNNLYLIQTYSGEMANVNEVNSIERNV